MKDFESVTHCEKCGHNLNEHLSSNIRRVKINYIAPIWELGESKEDEYMDTTCNHCGYSWKEKCKS